MSERKTYIPYKVGFSTFECTTIINNKGEKNYMELWFNPSVAVSSSHTLNVFFPVKSPELLDLFDIDMGTGSKDGDTIFCYLRT